MSRWTASQITATGEQEQQGGFGQRGDALDFAVAVLMLGVGRLAGNAHGKIGHDACAERSISEWPASDRIASEPVISPTTAFAAVEPRRRGDRSKRGLFLVVHR